MKTAKLVEKEWVMPQIVGALVVILAILATSGQPARPPRSFDTVVYLETTSEDSANVSMGDLDGDGDLDVLTSNDRSAAGVCWFFRRLPGSATLPDGRWPRRAYHGLQRP